MAKNNGVSVVFVHGGFVDGAGWEGVYKILKKDGYDVSIVQNSTQSLADDVAATKLVLAAQDGDVLLVGHSYGGAVITEAGNDPKVAGLVYIAAFAPDKGESVSTLIKDPPPGAPVPPILPPQDGFLFLDKANSARPSRPMSTRTRRRSWPTPKCRGASRRSAASISEPAWKTKPSWYLVATEDKMIPPAAQRFMSKRAGAEVVEEGQPRDLRVAAQGRSRAGREGRAKCGRRDGVAPAPNSAIRPRRGTERFPPAA